MKCKGCGNEISKDQVRENRFEWHLQCVVPFLSSQGKRIEELLKEKAAWDAERQIFVEVVDRQKDQLSALSRRQNVQTAPSRYQPSGSRGAVPRMDLTLEEMRALQAQRPIPPAPSPAPSPAPKPAPLPPPPPQTTTRKDRFELVELE